MEITRKKMSLRKTRAEDERKGRAEREVQRESRLSHVLQQTTMGKHERRATRSTSSITTEFCFSSPLAPLRPFSTVSHQPSLVTTTCPIILIFFQTHTCFISLLECTSGERNFYLVLVYWGMERDDLLNHSMLNM